MLQLLEVPLLIRQPGGCVVMFSCCCGCVALLTGHPLHPDQVVLVPGRRELLQVVAVVGLDAIGVVSQVLLVGVEQEVLHHVGHLHLLKDGQQDGLGDPADPAAAVQGAVGAGLPGALEEERELKVRPGGIGSKGKSVAKLMNESQTNKGSCGKRMEMN